MASVHPGLLISTQIVIIITMLIMNPKLMTVMHQVHLYISTVMLLIPMAVLFLSIYFGAGVAIVADL